MRHQFTHEDTRPTAVVRKEQYTLYCEVLIKVAAYTAAQSDWIPVTALCDVFVVGAGSLQRPLFFLASHGWVRLRTDAEGHITDVAMTPRGWQHRAVEG